MLRWVIRAKSPMVSSTRMAEILGRPGAPMSPGCCRWPALVRVSPLRSAHLLCAGPHQRVRLAEQPAVDGPLEAVAVRVQALYADAVGRIGGTGIVGVVVERLVVALLGNG